MESNRQPDLNAALRDCRECSAKRPTAEPPEGTEAALFEALTEALDELNPFRAREGARNRGGNAVAQCPRSEHRGGDGKDPRRCARPRFQTRLSERLKELLKGAQIDPQRLAQEAAILADRSDIGEELARLKIHSAQLAALLDGGGEIGKKLDFLLQEMNRETNTILSKTSGAGEAGLKITELALDSQGRDRENPRAV